METSRLERDRLARQRIENDIAHNFFVEASAGSGKTTALVNRMTAMIRAGIEVRRICAITFTKAAANEFFLRFQRRLAACARDAALPDEERERCANALLDIDLCFMGTIDSFCQMILSEHPSEAGMVMDARILSEEEQLPIYRREWRRAKQGEYGAAFDKAYADLCRYYARPDAVFEASILHFMDTREMLRRYDRPSGIDIDAAFAEEKAALINIAQAILDNPHCVNSTKSSMQKLESLRRKQGILLNSWEGNVDRVLKLIKEMDDLAITLPPEKIGIRHTEYFAPPKNKKGLYTLMLTEEGSAYGKLREEQYSAAMAAMDAFSKEAAVRLKATGELSFFDYLLYLRNLLRDDAEKGGTLIRHIRERHSYFLIDEFQDTNPMQAEIFFYLAAEDPVPDWKACLPSPGSLFIVGDPKQSIYRFRGADVSAFLRVKALFCEQVGDVLYLYSNFRSTKRMCAWFNDIFAALMPEESEYQSRFDPIPLGQKQETAGFGGVYHSVSSGNTEAADVADVIETLIGEATALIPQSNLPDAPLRRVEYGDIMVITWAKGTIAGIMEELARRGIPFRAEGKTSFSDCPAFEALCRLLGALAAPTDSLALYAALKDSLFGLSDQDLLAWRENGKRLSLFERGEGPVGEALSRLSMVRKQILDLPPCAAAQKALELFDIPDRCGIDHGEYVFFALELLRQAESTGSLATLPEMAAFLNRLLGNTPERSLALSEQKDGVHIANLHKVKGLEAPVVILAGINRKSRRPSYSIRRDGTKEICYTFKISEASRLIAAQTKKYGDAEEQELYHLNGEELRLLYVAATRAKNALILLTQENMEAATNTWGRFAGHSEGAFPLCSHSSAAVPCSAGRDMAAAIPDLGKRAARLRSAGEASFAIARPSTLKVKGKISSDDEYDDLLSEDMERAYRRKHAALLGTIAHRMMECIVSSGGPVDEDILTEELLSEYGLHGIDAEHMYQLIKSAVRCICHGGYPQKNGLPADILAELNGADGVYCEVPFCLNTEDAAYTECGLPTIWNGVMDLVYCKGGKWHIIDYKTNADPDDLDERYQAQLQIYRYAFEEMTGYSADAKVYHLDI